MKVYVGYLGRVSFKRTRKAFWGLWTRSYIEWVPMISVSWREPPWPVFIDAHQEANHSYIYRLLEKAGFTPSASHNERAFVGGSGDTEMTLEELLYCMPPKYHESIISDIV
jgi:hypothetical protein